MVDIKLTNSKTHRKERFVPIDPTNVRMYLCGPTVYDRAHLGNARPVVVMDVLYRLLRHEYGADAVTYVRNFTDVDDKINARAAETGRQIRAITDETIAWYHEDMDALGALRPSIRGVVSPEAEPRATDYIPQMVAMIEALIAEGHAYAAEGHVLFDVRSYPEYGRLSGRSVDDMIAGARVEIAPFKRDPMDFVLWKPSDEATPGWDSPWGRGRPGWHIECSAMSEALLGRSFDIHAGGIDLLFPHHENEIAQSCCAHPHSDFARVWLHNEMLMVDGKKMSKSLGNFFTVRDLLDGEYPISGEVIRFMLLMTHYRKPINWTHDKVREARTTLATFRSKIKPTTKAGSVDETLIQALEDDLNTSQYLQILRDFAQDDQPEKLKAGLDFIGLNVMGADLRLYDFGSNTPPEVEEAANHAGQISSAVLFEVMVRPNIVRFMGNETIDEVILKYRQSALGNIEIAAQYFDVKKSAVESFDVSARLTARLAKAADAIDIAALIEKRQSARLAKDFTEADRIRKVIKEAGLELRDLSSSTVWRGQDQ